MRVRIKVKNKKIIEWHGFFISKERKLINEAFNKGKDKSDGLKVISVKKLKL